MTRFPDNHGDPMRPPELTVEDVEILACALSDTDNETVEHLVACTTAADFEDILIRLMVARGSERTQLLEIAREAILVHRPSCSHACGTSEDEPTTLIPE